MTEETNVKEALENVRNRMYQAMKNRPDVSE
jgi:hypothetical protein